MVKVAADPSASGGASVNLGEVPRAAERETLDAATPVDPIYFADLTVVRVQPGAQRPDAPD